MTKLSQIIAVEKGVKSDATRRVTDLHRDVQKQPLLSGISRSYQPRDDEGDRLPPESTRVQVKADDVLAEAAQVLTRLFDVTLTKDAANCTAAADVGSAARSCSPAVPVTYLLFLEKQLTDVHTFVAKLPLLDPAEEWEDSVDAVSGCWKTQAGADGAIQEDPPEPCHRRGDEGASRAGAGLHRGCAGRRLDDGQVQRRAPCRAGTAAPRSRRGTPACGEVRPRGSQRHEVTDQKAGEAIFGYLFAA